MTVVLVPIVHEYGADGVLTVGLIAGVMLLALAFARAGAAMAYVPAPVIAGFTVGIACVIALQQVPSALGVPVPGGDQVAEVAARAAEEFGRGPQWAALALSLGSAAVMLCGARWKPGVPFSLVAVAAATLVAEGLGLRVTRIGSLPASLPAPSLAFFDVSRVPSLLAPAAASRPSPPWSPCSPPRWRTACAQVSATTPARNSSARASPTSRPRCSAAYRRRARSRVRR